MEGDPLLVTPPSQSNQCIGAACELLPVGCCYNLFSIVDYVQSLKWSSTVNKYNNE